MTEAQLRRYDGKEGRRAYVAYKGKVYDVTQSPMWEGGEHGTGHLAGRDLTEAMADAPHADDVFEGFAVVGELTAAEQTVPDTAQEMPEKALPPPSAKARWREFYATYHPHPATVHFPIALHFFAGGMDLLFFVQKESAYEVAVYYAFFVATVMGVVAMVPGILSWWVNYNFSMSRPFVVKMTVSTATLILGIVGILLHVADPRIAYAATPEGWFYHFCVLITVPAVVVLGYYGGKITWAKRT